MKMNLKFNIRFLSLVLSFVLSAFYASGHAEGRKFDRDYSKTKKIQAQLETHEGTLVLDLLFKESPNTVANFIHLADSGLYNGVIFHRIIQGFMAQTGDPDGDGTGGPGYVIDEEANSLKHEPGTVSMANAGMNTGGSQFFITHMPQPHLDGKHTIFGKLNSGFDVLTRLEVGDPIKSIKIIEEK